MESKALTFDHIVPKSSGGKTTWENIVTCCYRCNKKKSNKTLKQLGWKLKHRPSQPKWHPTLNIPLKSAPHREWTNFLDLAYYNVELEHDNSETDSR